MKWAVAAIATICLCGCARGRAVTLDDDARQYVRLALALGARDPDSLLDAYAGPPEWRTAANEAYRSFNDIWRDLVALRGRLRAQAEPADQRAVFLEGQVDALIARIDELRGARWPFGVEAARLFGVELWKPGLPRSTAPATARTEPPPPVPVSRVKQTFEQALARCRDETRRHVPLPRDESVVVDAASSERPWPAFTTYLGKHRSRVAINTAFRFTERDLGELACHEGYPGHHAIYVWQDDALVRAGRVEFWVEPLFSPQAFLDEAAASYAPALVPGIIDDLRSTTERDQARLAIAWRYLDGEMEFARAANALESLAGTPGGPFLKFVNQYRTYVAAYTAGRAMIARAVDKEPTLDARWQTYRSLVVRGRF